MPLQRFGTEAEVSAAIVFLLSEAAALHLRRDVCASTAPCPTPSGYRLPPNDTTAPACNGFHRAVLPKVLREE